VTRLLRLAGHEIPGGAGHEIAEIAPARRLLLSPIMLETALAFTIVLGTMLNMLPRKSKT
jgi:hypothetical protein